MFLKPCSLKLETIDVKCDSLGLSSIKRRFFRVNFLINAAFEQSEMWNFRPQGDGRSGPRGPLLPENKLNVFNMFNIEKIACSDLS